MTTELRPVTEQLTQTRFFGGKDRGTCLQVTQTGQQAHASNPLGIGFVQVTRAEAALLAAELLRFSVGEEVEAE